MIPFEERAESMPDLSKMSAEQLAEKAGGLGHFYDGGTWFDEGNVQCKPRTHTALRCTLAVMIGRTQPLFSRRDDRMNL